MPPRAEPAVSRYDGRAWRRLVLLADSHGALAAPLLEALGATDAIVHAGDVGDAAVLARLGAIAPLVAVRGNNDTWAAWPPADHPLLDALPEAARIAVPGGDLLVIHGHQFPQAEARHAALRRHFPDVRAIAYGHSHRRVVDRTGTPWILNPGACGRARVGAGASGLLLTVGSRGWRIAVLGPFAKDGRGISG